MNPAYTPFHPRWYRRRVSTYWWMFKWAHTKFILRELSSVFVAWFVVMTLLQIRALSEGQQAYAQFQQWLAKPAVVAANLISFCFVLLHTITWFNLAPQAMVVRVRGKRLPDAVVAASNYLGWLVVSAVLIWFLRER